MEKAHAAVCDPFRASQPAPNFLSPLQNPSNLSIFTPFCQSPHDSVPKKGISIGDICYINQPCFLRTPEAALCLPRPRPWEGLRQIQT